eukprot:5383436-Pyramimonas_sp.AAC.1
MYYDALPFSPSDIYVPGALYLQSGEVPHWFEKPISTEGSHRGFLCSSFENGKAEKSSLTYLFYVCLHNLACFIVSIALLAHYLL